VSALVKSEQSNMAFQFRYTPLYILVVSKLLSARSRLCQLEDFCGGSVFSRMFCKVLISAEHASIRGFSAVAASSLTESDEVCRSAMVAAL
jgi:hypothetical protein